MNIQKLTELAETLENLRAAEKTRLGFNMATYIEKTNHLTDRSGHHCGTIACVAGWAVYLAGELTIHADGSYSDPPAIVSKAQYLLDLSDSDANDLFHGSMSGYETPEQAARVIRHLIATGEANWDV